jgi:hypothetical protein
MDPVLLFQLGAVDGLDGGQDLAVERPAGVHGGERLVAPEMVPARHAQGGGELGELPQSPLPLAVVEGLDALALGHLALGGGELVQEARPLGAGFGGFRGQDGDGKRQQAEQQKGFFHGVLLNASHG